MHFSTLLALGAATLAAAAPASDKAEAKKNFHVSNFVFGCTVTCDWSFDVAIRARRPHHPDAKTPVHCAGSLDKNKDYVKCGHISDTQAIYAFIHKDTNQLMLEYEVQEPAEEAIYRYYGDKKVYAATSDQANLQKPNFQVKETKVTAVA